jgi:imidazole glycerol-phosphate synthase subunit HisF
MLKNRLIASLIIRDGLIVQSFNFKNYLPIGKPRFPIEFVARWDVDEITLVDISATPNNRVVDNDLVSLLSKYCSVPLTVGGGIKSVEDVRQIIRSGADKICINKQFIDNPILITEIAKKFGDQCVVLSIDCKKEKDGTYQVYTQSGNKPTGLSPEQAAMRAQNLGAGEILLNSIDRDGSRLGYDINLVKLVVHSVGIPVIVCGGVGIFSHFSDGIIKGGASAVAAANIFHHIEHSTILAKAHLAKKGINIRLDNNANYLDREFDDDGRLMMLDSKTLDEIELNKWVGRLDEIL